MNIFRFAGDLSHLIAIIILLQKIWHTRSCAGKLIFSNWHVFTGSLFGVYLMVFLDLFLHFSTNQSIDALKYDKTNVGLNAITPLGITLRFSLKNLYLYKFSNHITFHVNNAFIITKTFLYWYNLNIDNVPISTNFCVVYRNNGLMQSYIYLGHFYIYKGIIFYFI